MRSVSGYSIEWEIWGYQLENYPFMIGWHDNDLRLFYHLEGMCDVYFDIINISEPYYEKAQQDYYMEQEYSDDYNPYNFIHGLITIYKRNKDDVSFIYYHSDNQVTTDSIVPLTYEIVNGIEPTSEFPVPRPDLLPEEQPFREYEFYESLPMKPVEFSYGERTFPDCIVLEEGVNLIAFPKADPPYPTFDKLVISKQYGFLYVRLNSGTEYFRDDIR